MADFLKVRFRTPMPDPPENEVEYTLNGGEIGSERKTIPAPTEPPEEVLPGEDTSNRPDPQSVEMYIRPAGSPQWFMYRYHTEAPAVHQLDWSQDGPVGEMAVVADGFMLVDGELQMVSGVLEPVGWTDEIPPASSIPLSAGSPETGIPESPPIDVPPEPPPPIA